ncbi:MAG: amidohydrolase family protein [Hyphomicrobium sp.]
MSLWIKTEAYKLGLQDRNEPADVDAAVPVPSQVLSNGEFNPSPQNETQRKIKAVILEQASSLAAKNNVSRRAFLRSAAGFALSFSVMNDFYGPVFGASVAEAADVDRAEARAAALRDQFIFDDQLHFVYEGFSFEGLKGLRKYGMEKWVPEKYRDKQTEFEQLQFANFLREVYFDSDTKIGILSGAPADDAANWFLTNQEMKRAQDLMDELCGSRRMWSQAIVRPLSPGWLEEMDRCAIEQKPISWKGYTVGDPLSNSDFPYRLDDEKLMYPAYEKMMKYGIRTFCIHKGLLPNDYADTFHAWKHAMVDDVAKAAKDWPGINFVIFHSGLKPLNDYPEDHLRKFNETGRIDWVSDLAEIPAKHGVSNVYAELGSCFANCVISHPQHAAGLLGTLIKGMGADHVIWGTDSVWYGSPQWQIEAMRRMEIPEEMQKKFGFAPLGGDDSEVKRRIFGLNMAGIHGIDVNNLAKHNVNLKTDKLQVAKEAYLKDGSDRTNAFYGFIDKKDVSFKREA